MGVRLVGGELVNDNGSTEIPTVEEVDEGPAFTESTSGAPQCEVCGEDIEYSGRGRKPKYHPEHRPTAPKRSGSAPARSGSIRNEAALREALLSRYLQIGSLLSMMHPAYGRGVRQKAEEAVNADIELARVSPAFRRTLEGMLEKTALGAVIAVHAAMLAPVVVGESANAQRRKAAKAEAPRQAPRPAARRPEPPSDNVTHMYPSTESEVPAETVNAAAMPGMPG